MNLEDIQLMKKILSYISDTNNGNKLLFSVKYEHISKTNLILLKAFLEELNKNGVFVTIDRPHQYMEHLLRMHRIDYSNLLYVDTIARFSCGNFHNENDGSAKIIGTPFQIDLLPELFSFASKNKEIEDGIIDITDVDFILIDNIATMLNYNDQNTVEKFLESFINKLNRINKIFIPLLLDSRTHTTLYQVAKVLCDKEIDIENMEIIKADIGGEEKKMSLLPDRNNTHDLCSYRRCFTRGD